MPPPLLQIFFVEYWMDGIPHWRLLLSGPESREVVLVSAAHCNFVCKVMILPGVTSEGGLASEILFTGLRKHYVTERIGIKDLFHKT